MHARSTRFRSKAASLGPDITCGPSALVLFPLGHSRIFSRNPLRLRQPCRPRASSALPGSAAHHAPRVDSFIPRPSQTHADPLPTRTASRSGSYFTRHFLEDYRTGHTFSVAGELNGSHNVNPPCPTLQSCSSPQSGSNDPSCCASRVLSPPEACLPVVPPSELALLPWLASCPQSPCFCVPRSLAHPSSASERRCCSSDWLTLRGLPSASWRGPLVQ